MKGTFKSILKTSGLKSFILQTQKPNTHILKNLETKRVCLKNLGTKYNAHIIQNSDMIKKVLFPIILFR